MRTAEDASELLIVEEVAREMRTTVWAVRSWIRAGKLAALRPGKRLLVRRKDMQALLTTAIVAHAPSSASVTDRAARSQSRSP